MVMLYHLIRPSKFFSLQAVSPYSIETQNKVCVRSYKGMVTY